MATVIDGGGGTGVSGVPYYQTIYDPVTGTLVKQVKYGINGQWQNVGATGASQGVIGGGGGGGGNPGGGKSIDYTQTGAYYDVQMSFADWMGWDWVNSHKNVVDTAFNNRWSADQIRRESMLTYGGGGPLAEAAWRYVRSQIGYDAPASFVQNIVANGFYTDPNFVDFYAPGTSSSAVLQNAASAWYVDEWNSYTGGAHFGPTAQNKLVDLVQRYGWDGAKDMWLQWLPTTQSAGTGNYGANKRETISSLILGILHREPTEAELSPDGPLWKMLTGDLGNLDTAAALEWLRGTDEYQTLYAAKPATMSESDYWSQVAGYNSVGNWYFNDKPTLGGVPGQDFFQGYTTEELQSLLGEGWTPGDLKNYYQSLEEANFQRGVYGPMLEEAFGYSFTDDEWFALANGGQGSGALRVKLVEAQNRLEFKEAFMDYNGREPTPDELGYLASSFVSPNQYARNKAAEESADEMLPEVNDLLNRVFGTGTSLGELKNMAMGGKGSGALKAKINQAMRLDQYRWIHKQKYGTEPTPADYAKYAGYAGPAELSWELTLNEDIGEFGPEIQEAWTKVYGEAISDADLRIMLGDMKGSGELKYKAKKAQEQVKEEEAAHDAGFTTPGAYNLYGSAPQGGFKEAMVGLADMN